MASQKNRNVILGLTKRANFTKWFEQAYNTYFERLYRYAFSITKSKDLAEDVVEEVFVNIWEKQDGDTEIKSLDKYLYIATKHLAVSAASKNPDRFVYSYSEETLQISDVVDPESLLLSDELEKMISDAIKSLPAHCALVYDLVKIQGKSYEEVAVELGISKKTVESHIHKALLRIKEKLSLYFEERIPQIKRISTVIAIVFFVLLLV